MSNDKEIQQQELIADQARLKDFFTKFYKEQGGPITGVISKRMREAPEAKKERLKRTGIYSAVGAGLGAITRRPAIAAVGAALGAGAGYGHYRERVHASAKKKLQDRLSTDMQEEARKNVLIHTILAKPGKQALSVKRPWGVERYEG